MERPSGKGSDRLRQVAPEAFTIVELLVVITILAVLLALLLPSLSKAREEVRRVICMSNERQLGIYLEGYATNNVQAYPHQQAAGPGKVEATGQSVANDDDGWLNASLASAGLPGVRYGWWNGTATSYPDRRVTKYEGPYFCPNSSRSSFDGTNFAKGGVGMFNRTSYQLNCTLFGDGRRSWDPLAANYFGAWIKNPITWTGPVGNDMSFTLRLRSSPHKVPGLFAAKGQAELWAWNQPLGDAAAGASPLQFVAFQEHFGSANVYLMDGHVQSLTTTIYMRIGPPQLNREFAYW